MRNEIQEAFSAVHADETLKNETMRRLSCEIEKRQRKPALSARYVLTALLCLLLVGSGLGGHSLYYTPTGYLSIDVNPSIELTLNRFDRVISTAGYNDDGAAVLASLPSLQGRSYADALDMLLTSDRFQRYLNTDSDLNVTVVSETSDDTSMLSTVQHCVAQHHTDAQCSSANAEEVAAAHECGLSVGKYLAFQTLQQYDSTVTAEDCQDMTMREIHDRIAACQDETGHDTGETEHSNGHGNGNGTGAGSGAGNGNGTGAGNGSGNGNGTGAGNGSGNGNGTGAGNGSGNGNGTGSTSHDDDLEATGMGNGYGAGNGSGNGADATSHDDYAETTGNENTEGHPSTGGQNGGHHSENGRGHS